MDDDNMRKRAKIVLKGLNMNNRGQHPRKNESLNINPEWVEYKHDKSSTLLVL